MWRERYDLLTATELPVTIVMFAWAGGASLNDPDRSPVTTRAVSKEGRPMLVLSRKQGEKVVIGRQIEVTLLAVVGDRVKLGFTAPDEIPIHREEVFRRIDTPASAVAPVLHAAECA